MISLDLTSQTLRSLLGGATTTNALQYEVRYTPRVALTPDLQFQPQKATVQFSNSDGTNEVTMCAAPNQGEVLDISYIRIYNADTVAATITIFIDDGTNRTEIRVTLATLESLFYEDGRGWYVITASGGIKQGGVLGPGTTVDNTLVRWDGTTGTQIQGSNISVTDADVVTMPTAGQILLDDSITTAGSNLPLAFEGDTNTGFFRPSADILAVATGGTERARTTLEGYFKASNAGSYITATGLHHELVSDAAEYVLRARNAHASTPQGLNLAFSAASPDNNTQDFLVCLDSTTNRLIIWSDGDVVNADNSYGAISDERLKQDILPSASQWDDIKALRLIKYRDITDVKAYGDRATVMLGLVAQDVEKTSPGLVTESPEFEEYDEQVMDVATGTPLIGVTEKRRRQTGRKIKAVQYSIAYLKALGALQEAMKRIEALEAQKE